MENGKLLQLILNILLYFHLKIYYNVTYKAYDIKFKFKIIMYLLN